MRSGHPVGHVLRLSLLIASSLGLIRCFVRARPRWIVMLDPFTALFKQREHGLRLILSRHSTGLTVEMLKFDRRVILTLLR